MLLNRRVTLVRPGTLPVCRVHAVWRLRSDAFPNPDRERVYSRSRRRLCGL